MAEAWLFLKFLAVNGMIPYKRICSLKEVLYFRERVKRANANQNWKRIVQYKIFIWILLLKVIHRVYLYFTELDDLGRLMHLEAGGMTNLPKGGHIIVTCPSLLMACYLFYEIYLNKENSIAAAIQDGMIEMNENLYQGPFENHWYQGLRKVRRTTMLIYNSFQIFVVVIGECVSTSKPQTNIFLI